MVEESKALAVLPTGGELSEIMTIGKVLAASGFFKDTTSEARAVAKILAGREIGVGPIAAMQGVVIIQDKVSYTANLMATLIDRSERYRYRVRKLDATGCDLEFFERTGPNAWEPLGHSTFGPEDAKAAGLASGMYQKYARNMFFARAMSNGAKWYCPGVFGGVTPYTPEELGATVNQETGEVIDVPAQVIEAEPEAAKPAPAKPAKDRRQVYWDRYQELWGEAQALGITDAETVKGDDSLEEIERKAKALKDKIAKRQAELAVFADSGEEEVMPD